VGTFSVLLLYAEGVFCESGSGDVSDACFLFSMGFRSCGEVFLGFGSILLYGGKGGGGGVVFVYVSRVGGYSLNSYGVMIVVVRGATRVDGQSKHTDENLVEVYASISSNVSVPSSLSH